MKVKTRRIQNLVILFAALFFYLPTSHASRWGYQRERWLVGVEGDYFKTTENFNSNGNRSDLAPGQSFTEIPIRFQARFDIEDHFSFFGEGDLNQASSVTGATTRKATKFTQGVIGADFRVMRAPFLLVPEIKVVMPAQTVSASSDEVIANEGVYEVQGGLYLSKLFRVFRGSGYLGYDYRMDGRSALLVWDLSTRTRLGHFYLDAMLTGSSSIRDDSDTEQAAGRRAILDNLNGGSFRYTSVNPSLMEVRGAVGYSFKKDSELYAGYGYTLKGTRAAYGATIFAGLRWNFPGHASPRSSPEEAEEPVTDSSKPTHSRNRRDIEKAIDSFTPDVPQDVENLFDEEKD